jgi:hypothetical protein
MVAKKLTEPKPILWFIQAPQKTVHQGLIFHISAFAEKTL